MTPETAAVVANWWACAFERDDARQAFQDDLYRRVLAEDFADDEDFRDKWKLSVDYDPSPTLLAAIRAAGIECRGFMYSADGLLPFKTRMSIWRDTGTVEVSQIVYRDGRRVADDVVIHGPPRSVEIELLKDRRGGGTGGDR